MNPKTHIVVPCHWDYGVLDILAKQNERYIDNNINVTDMYGALAGEPIGNGRSQNKITKLNRQEAIAFRNRVREKGIQFNYLLNNSIPFANNPSTEKVYEYLDWIIEKFIPDGLLIASKDLMKMVRERYGSIPIHVSTIAGVTSANDLEKFADILPERVVVHNDTARDFKNLEEVVTKSRELKIDVEILATESCLRKCPYMQEHRDHISRGGDDSYIQCACNTKKLQYPSQILRANFIRPEDIDFYRNVGINFFKISGRSKQPVWLPEVTEAYLGQSYAGNLIRLLGIDPNINAERWIFINNSALNGFLEGFPRTGESEDELEYCDFWVRRLFSQGDLIIEGFDYQISEGRMVCVDAPEKVRGIYQKNEKSV